MNEMSYVITTQVFNDAHKVELVTGDLSKALEKQGQLLNFVRVKLGYTDFEEFLRSVETFQRRGADKGIEWVRLECYSGRDTHIIELTRQVFIR